MCKHAAVLRPSSIILAACGLFGGCGAPAPETPADIVLINGGIYTVDAGRRWAEAAAIRHERIVMVGNNASVAGLIGPATEVIDLDGRMAMPGMIDSHVHPIEGGYEQVYCNLWDYSSITGVLDALRACDAGGDPSNPWFQAVGLDLGLFGITGPDKSLLDGIAPGKFIFVDASDGHAALVNDEVLDLVGFGPDTPDPENGVIERRDGSREPNGTVRETARDLVDALRPNRDLATSIGAMTSAVRKMNSFGITGAVDAWIGEHEMRVYKALEEAGELSLRVHGAIIDEGPFQKHTGDDLERVIENRHRFESPLISYGSIKIMVDGVFEGETAAVLEPYDSTGDTGLLNHSPDVLLRRVAHYYDRGFQLHFHTMGDRATRAALDALEFARGRGNPALRAGRHALSHLGLIDPADYPRFAEQNAVAAFTAEWAYPDEWTVNLEIPTLGRERVDRLYPLRSVLDAGGTIVGSSDWNYGELDPLLSIETAITRRNPYGPSQFRASTQEAVDLAAMIDAYTINGAWLMRQEGDVGSVEPGKLADIVVFDTNLFEVDAEAISDARVDATIFNGRIVYTRTTRQ